MPTVSFKVNVKAQRDKKKKNPAKHITIVDQCYERLNMILNNVTCILFFRFAYLKNFTPEDEFEV